MSDDQQAWNDEVQEIVFDFIDEDNEDHEVLGELMLDRSEQYWEQSFFEGLTPQQALDRFALQLQQTNMLEEYKSSKRKQAADSWWQYEMSKLLFKLSKIDADDEECREEYELKLKLLIDRILARYRTV
jgi:hypothetical protein